MKNLGIVFTSRNNYELLDDWMNITDTEGFDILNIDEDSLEENKEIGKKICEKHNIVYMDREERGMSYNILTASNFYKSRGIDWILWFSHDTFPSTEYFFSKVNDIISTKAFDEFGVVGFNGHQLPGSTSLCKKGIKELDITGRTCFWGDGWYRNKKYYPKSRPDYSINDFNFPFSVDSVAWFAAMVNIDMYKKHIIPTDEFHLFYSWDDIAFQYLQKNVYNICIPNLDIIHDKNFKITRGFTDRSPRDNGKREFYYGKWGHHKSWLDKWGFPYETFKDRESQRQNMEKHKGTLIWEHYNHDPSNGPLKTFNLI